MPCGLSFTGRARVSFAAYARAVDETAVHALHTALIGIQRASPTAPLPPTRGFRFGYDNCTRAVRAGVVVRGWHATRNVTRVGVRIRAVLGEQP